MPAWPAGPDRRVPGSFAGFRSFPEGEVAGAVFFILIDIDAGAVSHAGEILFDSLPYSGNFAMRK